MTMLRLVVLTLAIVLLPSIFPTFALTSAFESPLSSAWVHHKQHHHRMATARASSSAIANQLRRHRPSSHLTSHPAIGQGAGSYPPLFVFCSLSRRILPVRFTDTRLFQGTKFTDEGGGNNADHNSGNVAYPSNAEDDALKWERMYYAPSKGAQQQQQQHAPLNNLDGLQTLAPSSATASDTVAGATNDVKSDVRVVTFDLDNTIWKTSETISDANDALSDHLKSAFGIDERSEKMMGKLFKDNPDGYAGVDYRPGAGGSIVGASGDNDGDDAKEDAKDYSDVVQNVGRTDGDAGDDTDSGVHIGGKEAKKRPVYLTSLRKDAIRALIEEAMSSSSGGDDARMSPSEVERHVDDAFEVWVDARCESISRNFAPSAVTLLTSLRGRLSRSPTGASSQVYIGAITDGNSNPNRVSELSGLFDFVIRAEDVGASKPDKRVYRAAVAALMARLVKDGRSVGEFFLGGSSDDGEDEGVVDMYATYMTSNSAGAEEPSWKDVEDEAVEVFADAVGPWWVHIGDDFFKDVVAAKEFQMRTVWVRELIGGSGSGNGNAAETNKGGGEGAKSSEKKQRSVADLVDDVSKSGGVIQMSIGASEFLSNALHKEFSDAILDRFSELGDLLTRWQEEGRGTQRTADVDGPSNMPNAPEADGLDTTRVMSAALEMESKQQSTMTLDSQPNSAEKKFCVFCGGQLPSTAKFCSHCGERQI